MEKGARRFEELWVWQQTRELVKEVYEDSRSGPGSTDYGFRHADTRRSKARQISAGIASLATHLRKGA